MPIRRRSGISYIMSVAIMTFVTVALASVVLTWGIGQVSQSQNVFGSAINARANQAMERFNVEDVQFMQANSGGCPVGATNGCVVIYVRNVGSIQLVVDAVYINNQLAAQNLYTVNSVTPAKLSLGMQQLGSIMVQAPFQLSSGNSYTISAASTRGNLATVVQTY